MNKSKPIFPLLIAKDLKIVTETTTEEVMKLKGGGDRDTAYLMFYRYKDFKTL